MEWKSIPTSIWIKISHSFSGTTETKRKSETEGTGKGRNWSPGSKTRQMLSMKTGVIWHSSVFFYSFLRIHQLFLWRMSCLFYDFLRIHILLTDNDHGRERQVNKVSSQIREMEGVKQSFSVKGDDDDDLSRESRWCFFEFHLLLQLLMLF